MTAKYLHTNLAVLLLCQRHHTDLLFRESFGDTLVHDLMHASMDHAINILRGARTGYVSTRPKVEH